jgi:hypothetical protein
VGPPATGCTSHILKWSTATLRARLSFGAIVTGGTAGDLRFPRDATAVGGAVDVDERVSRRWGWVSSALGLQAGCKK